MPQGSSVVARAPGLFERSYATLALFLLAYSIPTVWLRVPDRAESGSVGGDTLDLVVFLLVLGACVPSVLLGLGSTKQLRAGLTPVAALCAYLVLSSAWSEVTSISARRGIALSLTSVFAYYLACRFSRPSQLLRLLSSALAIGTVLNVVFIFAFPRFGDSAAGWTGIVANKNGLGRISVLAALCHALSVFNRPRFRLFYLSLTIVNVVLVFGSNSTTAFVGLLSLAGFAIVVRGFRARELLFGATVASLMSATALTIAVVYGEFAALTRLLGKDPTLTGRAQLWEDAIEFIMRRPLIGYGYDGFWVSWFSPSHEMWIRNPWLPPHSHNGALEALLAGGIPALLLLAVLLYRSLVGGVAIVRTTDGAAALFPVLFSLYLILTSLTERGFLTRSVFWAVFVWVVVQGGVGLDQYRTKLAERASGRSAPSNEASERAPVVSTLAGS